ncbi:uncharacterized protein PITG_00532 [Phytophthora infestans T30-4]|uniref:Uncharacterized protein n=1 Tax=Phytophthora infestans (strain T30-4) TaxID=403677 RepID=D0MR18_PHYIT|nr:uncharacterized protein PITG_00532 [Phytophthora infestans T30-4]EEY57937.1 hypothetical protein PITG_00532 [Phytophthora infestans T30-4]|eukprot:XP_002909123.1 hypothetical protein PITG_00532 [Phytophthora infestans T30-4]
MVMDSFHVGLSLATISRHITTHPLVDQGNNRKTSMTEARMQHLKGAAHVCMRRVTQQLEVQMELHTRDFANVAICMEYMSYDMRAKAL